MKSFPDFSESATSADKSKVFSGEDNREFQLPSFFWDAVATDPAIAREFDRRVEARALDLLRNETTDAYKALREVAHQEGIQAGIVEGRSKLESLRALLEKAAQALAAERELLQQRNNTMWSEVFCYLCERFLQPLTPERLVGLERWMEQAIGSAVQQGGIQVAVSPGVHALIETAGAALKTDQWVFNADPNLSDSDLRVELKGGGLIFNAEAEVGVLRQKIDEVLGKKTT